MTISKQLLDAVFGPESRGETADERARSSRRVFVRSLFQIAEDSPPAMGRRLTALEALDAFGWDVMAKLGAEGFALLAADRFSAGTALRQRIQELGLSPKHVANSANVPLPDVERLLTTDPQIPLRMYERVASSIGLDERQLAIASEPRGNEAVAVRLRTLVGESPRMTPSVVIALAEAAWVASTQARLEQILGLRRPPRFEPSPNYGGPGYPPYVHGYWLAATARTELKRGNGPIHSLRALAEDELGVPIIQANLGEHIAGVTLDTGGVRAIVLNLGAHDRTVLMRRSTIAHELGHLLFDPSHRLNVLRVDDSAEIDQRADQVRDPVEQRANAYSVEFIAPQSAVLEIFDKNGGANGDGLFRVVDTLGISPTSARYQVWNGLERRIPLESIRLPKIPLESLQAWEAAEAYTVDVHPLQRLRWSRRGRFSAVVLSAAEKGMISWDTAGQYLESSVPEVQGAGDAIRELFPQVFNPS